MANGSTGELAGWSERLPAGFQVLPVCQFADQPSEQSVSE
jgi:hypothetical protein